MPKENGTMTMVPFAGEEGFDLGQSRHSEAHRII
jgi:hypothetical protein